MIRETGDKETVKLQHKALIDDFERMRQTDGWKRIAEYLRNEGNRAFNDMTLAKSGEEALKASTGFVLLKKIADFPENAINASAERLKQMELAEVAENEEKRRRVTRRNQP